MDKLAVEKPVSVYALSGELYASRSGWIMLRVPNELVRGVFAALDVPGVELPPGADDTKPFDAHISVMRPEELESLGGVDKITERGKRFRYNLGPVQEVTPAGWADMNRVWFIKVNSPELTQLRRSYGLSSKPNNDQFEFHITVAVRRKRVLSRTPVAKKSSLLDTPSGLLQETVDKQRQNFHWEPGQGIGGNLVQNLQQMQQQAKQIRDARYGTAALQNSLNSSPEADQAYLLSLFRERAPEYTPAEQFLLG